MCCVRTRQQFSASLVYLFVTSLLTHISINSQPFLVGIVSHKAAEEYRGGGLHVDVYLTECNKQFAPTFFVHATAKHFLNTVNKALEQRAPILPKMRPWLQRKAKLQAELPVKIPHFLLQMVEVVGEDGNLQQIKWTLSSAQAVIHELN